MKVVKDKKSKAAIKEEERLEKLEIAINKPIIGIYDLMKEQIPDNPEKLCIAVARVYAHSILLNYKKNQMTKR
jgi:hypothetical protein